MLLIICTGAGHELHVVFIHEVRHCLWVHPRKFHPLQHVVAVVKFLSHMPKQVSFGQGM